MVMTGAADVSPLLREEVYRQYYSQLPSFRREKADSLQKPLQKAQSVGVWILYELWKRKTGMTAGAVYNLSHSGHLVLCAIGSEKDTMVGCDIEQIKSCREGVVRRFFHPAEQHAVLGISNEAERCEMFHRYWVLKESLMKAVRLGGALPMDSFCVEASEAKGAVLLQNPPGYSESFYFKEYPTPIAGYCIAVCATDAHFSDEITLVELDQI